MTEIKANGDPVGRARAEAALTDYPDLSNDRLEALVQWFKKDASALDVALIASNEAITHAYRDFRAQHIDRLKGSDILKGIACLAILGAIVLFIAWQAQ